MVLTITQNILHVHLETCQANTGPLTREPVIGSHRLWPLNICVPLHTGHLHKYITGGILLFFGLHTLLLCCLCISCNLCTDKFWADMPRYPEYSSWALWPLRKIQNTQAEHYSPWEMQYVALHTLCTIKKFWPLDNLVGHQWSWWFWHKNSEINLVLNSELIPLCESFYGLKHDQDKYKLHKFML